MAAMAFRVDDSRITIPDVIKFSYENYKVKSEAKTRIASIVQAFRKQKIDIIYELHSQNE